MQVRTYGLARHIIRQAGVGWSIVNDVAGFIGPEVFRDPDQLERGTNILLVLNPKADPARARKNMVRERTPIPHEFIPIRAADEAIGPPSVRRRRSPRRFRLRRAKRMCSG